MKAIVHGGKKGIAGLQWKDHPVQNVGAGDIRVALKVVGLNHRDLFQIDAHPPEAPEVVLGADGAGTVTEVGAGVTGFAAGDEVILYPGVGWKEPAAVAPKEFRIYGNPIDGTFREEMVVNAAYAVKKPAYLSWEEAGVLPLAGLTAYRALFTRGEVQKGQRVLIPGIGGGVANFLLQFALAAGAEVIVTSRSEEKLRYALSVGARKGLLNDQDWGAELNGEKVDLVIESVGAATFQKSLDQLKGGGAMVIFGSSTGDTITFNLREFFYGQYDLRGSTMGSLAEFKQMIQFLTEHQLHPTIDQVYPITDYRLAFRRLREGGQLGKIALVVNGEEDPG